MAGKSKRKSRRRVDPNQLSLLDYRPAAKISAPGAKAKPLQRSSARASNDDRVAPNVLTPKQAALYLNLSIATLKSWRKKKTGPVFVKRGARLIGYKPADLDAYMSSQ